ncbi:MAG: SPOR domain-containing protein [Pseudolabrys sp.]|nr:SPOR domain-containing protein [Pseudolabrys sp.]
MAEDNRNYRARDAYGRPAAGAAQGNDPLAELARLIGQTDPFSEFGRDNRAAPPAQSMQASAPPPGYGDDRYRRDPNFAAPPSVPQQFAHEADQYQGYQTPQLEPQQAAEYDARAYYNDATSSRHDDVYDDEVPPRRRISIIAIAGVFALAVVGTAGAFGYRALFGSSGSSPPPVIKADTTPTKVVPAAANSSDSQSNKLITDRVGDRSQLEKLVSREEQPIDLNKPPQGAFPNMPTAAAAQPAAPAATNVPGEPKKIRTIAIRPDGSADNPPASPQSTVPIARTAAAPPSLSPQVKPAAPQRATADAEPPAPAPSAPRQVTATARPAPSSNAPLSLNPDTGDQATAAPPRAAARAPAPVRTASAPASSDPGAPGAYVQVSSQRSEAEAQSAFRSLQGKYPSQLGSRSSVIRRADLGDKGTFYRAMVGPFATADQAAELCTSLKSAGGQCIVQRN